jgi:hypothetical protein
LTCRRISGEAAGFGDRPATGANFGIVFRLFFVLFLLSCPGEIAGRGRPPPMEAIHFIQDLAVILVVAGVVGWVCQRLGLSTVVGYLAAGWWWGRTRRRSRW